MNLGKAIFYLIYQKKISYQPKLFFYQTLSPNFFFGFHKRDYKLTEKLMFCHKTQFWLFQKMSLFLKLLAFWYGFSTQGFWFAEGYRQIDFNTSIQTVSSNNLKKKPSIWAYIWMIFFWKHKSWFNAQYPEKIIYPDLQTAIPR
jgi:hypothetical protein